MKTLVEEQFEVGGSRRRTQGVERPSPRRSMTKLAVPVALALAAGMVAACNSSAASTTTTKSLIPVTVAQYPGVLATSSTAIGQHFGLFKQHGLAVNLVSTASGPQNVSELVSGAVDFAVVSPPLTLRATQQGADIVYLENDFKIDFGIIARKGLSLPHASEPFPAPLQDLKGLKIGVSSLGSIQQFFAQAALKRAGVDPGQVTFVSLTASNAAQAAAFETGKVDALVDAVPMDQVIGKQNYVTLLSAQQAASLLYPNYIFDAWATTTQFAKDHPSAIRAFCTANQAISSFMASSANADKIENYLSTFMNLPKSQATLAWQGYKSSFELQPISRTLWNDQASYNPGVPLPPFATAVQNCPTS